MLWEFELGSLLLVAVTAIASGGSALIAGVWRFGKRTEKYDEVAEHVAAMDVTLKKIHLDLVEHIARTEPMMHNLNNRMKRMEIWRDERFNGSYKPER